MGLDSWSDDWVFVRKDQEPNLYQRLVVSFAGRGLNVVGALAFVLPTQHVNPKGIGEDRLLVEIAGMPERGQTILNTRDEAVDWERRLAEVAPVRAQELAREKGPAVLERTDAARRAVEGYLSAMPRLESPYAQRRALESRLDTEKMEAAHRLAGWPGVVQLREAEEIYEVACMSLAAFKEEVEGPESSFDIAVPPANVDLTWRLRFDPLYNQELLFRINLLTDALISEWNGKEGSGVDIRLEDRLRRR